MTLAHANANPVDQYCTHQPVLRALPRVRRVLECGAGWFSTPILAAMCDTYQGYDDSPEWAGVLTAAAQGAYTVQGAPHVMLETARRSIEANVPDLAFIDCGTPHLGWCSDRGKIAVMALRAGVRYVVLHDTEPRVWAVYDWADAMALARYRLDWPGRWYGVTDAEGKPVAATSVLSMIDDLAEVRRNLRMP